MKQLKLNKRDYVFVPVPDHAYEFEIRSPKIDSYFRFNYRTESNVYHGMAFLFKDFGGRAKYPISMNFIATTDNIPTELGITSNTLAYVGITGRHAIIEKI